MKVFIYQDRSGGWRWRAVDGNHRIIADGSEGYVTRAGAARGLDNVMQEFRADVQVLQAVSLKRGASKPGEPAQLLEIEGEHYDVVAEYQAEGAH